MIILRATSENMATENQKTIPNVNTSEPLPDHELFAGKLQLNNTEQVSEHDVFAGNEDFHKSLADNTKAATAKPSYKSYEQRKITALPDRQKRFSNTQKALVLGIIAITVILLYTSLISPSKHITGITPKPTHKITPTAQQMLSTKPPIKDLTQTTLQQVEKTQPLSLKAAQDLYLTNDYSNAYTIYNTLRQSLPQQHEQDTMRDFLQLKMALCMQKAAQDLQLPQAQPYNQQAQQLFRLAAKSPSLIVSALANYHQSLLQLQTKQYLMAQTKLYQALALIDAVDFDRNWALSFRKDCHFLIAESLTKYVLSLSDADKDLPDALWNYPGTLPDPFINLTESQLRQLLNDGSQQLKKAVLAPQIQKINDQTSQPNWSVICNTASIEELLARFAANAGLNIKWNFDAPPDSDEIKNALRKKPVTLYLPNATSQQVTTIAAGCAGLLAQLDQNKTINIFNPQKYSSLTQHIPFLTDQAVSLWQRFILTFHSDERVPNAHFALGLLQDRKDHLTDAIAEYKLVANRFQNTPLAPFALLLSSKLKTRLNDHSGARQDLMQLTELYPDTEISGQAYLQLADATMKTGRFNGATRIYTKVYHLAFSTQSQLKAALAAAKCYYQENNYESAEKWLTRYINLNKDQKDNNLSTAYFLLGKTNLALGKKQQAYGAFNYALKGRLNKDDYIQTLSTLVKTCIEQENLLQALSLIQMPHPWQFSKKESIDFLILKSNILRAIGLADKAILELSDREQYLTNNQLKAKVALELANCYIDNENLDLASKKLTEILVLVEPGPTAHEATCKLADVYLRLGKINQTIDICSQLLNWKPSEQIKQKTITLLATAYKQQKNYDKATETLLGQSCQPQGITEKTTSEILSHIEQSTQQDLQNQDI